jgi:hypothetical protein
VRRRGHDPADGVEVVDREVDERRVDHADVDHVHADRANAVNERVSQVGRVGTHVAADDHRVLALGLLVRRNIGSAALEELRRRMPDLPRPSPR